MALDPENLPPVVVISKEQGDLIMEYLEKKGSSESSVRMHVDFDMP